MNRPVRHVTGPPRTATVSSRREGCCVKYWGRTCIPPQGPYGWPIRRAGNPIWMTPRTSASACPMPVLTWWWVAGGRQPGVDVEPEPSENLVSELADVVLSPPERDALDRTVQTERPAWFG